MCEPTTIMLVVTAVAGAVSAYGQYQEGVATQNYYNSVAQTQEQQAKLEAARGEKQSELIQNSAKWQGLNQAQKATALSSAQRAAMAANGVDLSSVTSQDIASDTMSRAKMDEMAIRYNADINTWNTKEDAKYKKWALQTEAEYSRTSGHNAMVSAKNQVGMTLLSTVASMAGGLLSSGAGTAGNAGNTGKTMYINNVPR